MFTETVGNHIIVGYDTAILKTSCHIKIDCGVMQIYVSMLAQYTRRLTKNVARICVV